MFEPGAEQRLAWKVREGLAARLEISTGELLTLLWGFDPRAFAPLAQRVLHETAGLWAAGSAKEQRAPAMDPDQRAVEIIAQVWGVQVAAEAPDAAAAWRALGERLGQRLRPRSLGT